MAISKAHTDANHRYDEKAYMRVTVRIKRDYEEKVRQYSNGSLNKFINDAIMEKIERLEKESND